MGFRKHYSLSSLSFPHWFVVWQGLRTITRYWTARLHCQYNLVQNFNIMPRNYLMWFTSSWQLIIWVFVNSNWISICLKQRVMWRDKKCFCLNSLAGSLFIALGCMKYAWYTQVIRNENMKPFFRHDQTHADDIMRREKSSLDLPSCL